MPRFDPDSLSLADWSSIEAVDASPTDPGGAEWADDATTLVKLAEWAGWGLVMSRPAARVEARALQFDPDALLYGEWDVVRLVEAQEVDPDGSPWQADVTTLGRLVAWARFGLSQR